MTRRLDGTMETQNSDITRRDLLKRGAIVGGVTLWATPVVQVVGMGRAYAKDVSPDCSRYCLKWNFDDNQETTELTCTTGGISAHRVWTNNWEEIGSGAGAGRILTCPEDGINDEDAADRLTNAPGRPFIVYGSQLDGFYISFPDDVKLADLTDEDEPSVAVKCGQDSDTFKKGEIEVLSDPCYLGYRRIHIERCDNDQDISHIELILDWCPGEGTII